ncbi:hypothetical protein [Laceyella putida]|uniref:Uncharacterized protein n=1 Tax=Laceyella putida TaxID=110101 RepID=A0ABW2RLY7_9BACL
MNTHPFPKQLWEPTLTLEQRMAKMAEQLDLFPDDWEKLNLAQGYAQFSSWLLRLWKHNPPYDDIQALLFGIFETEKGLQLYIAGSSEWDGEDEEWADEPEYFPEERYPEISSVAAVESLMKQDLVRGIDVAIGVIALFVIHFTIDHAEYLLQSRERLWLATGFDEGELIQLGCLKMNRRQREIGR